MINATLVPLSQGNVGVAYHVSSATEAAERLDCSVSAVRRAVRSVGVSRIAGRSVEGFVDLASPRYGGPPVRLAVHEIYADAAD